MGENHKHIRNKSAINIFICFTVNIIKNLTSFQDGVSSLKPSMLNFKCSVFPPKICSLFLHFFHSISLPQAAACFFLILLHLASSLFSSHFSTSSKTSFFFCSISLFSRKFSRLSLPPATPRFSAALSPLFSPAFTYFSTYPTPLSFVQNIPS